MSEAIVFPDVADCMFDLIDGSTHLGESVRAATWLPANADGTLQGPFPLAHIDAKGGTEGYLDRVDRVAVDVYAPGQQALDVLESIKASICGTDIETPSGYLDGIAPDITPADVPYQSDSLNKASATFLVTSRPIN